MRSPGQPRSRARSAAARLGAVRIGAATACAAAMGTGIVSLDLDLAGLVVPSTVLLAIAGIIDVGLLVSGGLFREIAGVPAVAVVGSGLAARGGRPWPLLVLGAVLWAAHLRRLRLPRRTNGSDLLPVVATQALVALAGSIQRRAAAPGLTVPAIAVLCAGWLGYAVLIARFRARELSHGNGDQWIGGGAAAITALACAALAVAGDGRALTIGCVVVWALAMAWLPFLVAGELLRPRVGTLARRWSTVFPVGMYAAASFAVAVAADLPVVHAFALAWTGVAAVVWLAVASGAVRRA